MLFVVLAFSKAISNSSLSSGVKLVAELGLLTLAIAFLGWSLERHRRVVETETWEERDASLERIEALLEEIADAIGSVSIEEPTRPPSAPDVSDASPARSEPSPPRTFGPPKSKSVPAQRRRRKRR